MILLQIIAKSLLLCGTVGIVLAYLNCHMYIVFVVVFTLVTDTDLEAICLFVCNQWLVVIGYY